MDYFVLSIQYIFLYLWTPINIKWSSDNKGRVEIEKPGPLTSKMEMRTVTAERTGRELRTQTGCLIDSHRN